MADKYDRLAAALARWKRDDPATYRRVWLGHGSPKPPTVDALTGDDPEMALATAELHDPCDGTCEGVCSCG